MHKKIKLSKIVGKSRTIKDGLIAVAVSLITLAAERSIEATLFRCPCEPEQRHLYSGLFIGVPAAILLVVGIAFNMKVWKLIIGCCPSKRYCCSLDFFKKMWKITGCCSTKKCCCCTVEFGNFCTVLAFAVISPTIWIILTLIDGDYLACARTQVAYVDIVNVTCIPVSMQACR